MIGKAPCASIMSLMFSSISRYKKSPSSRGAQFQQEGLSPQLLDGFTAEDCHELWLDELDAPCKTNFDVDLAVAAVHSDLEWHARDWVNDRGHVSCHVTTVWHCWAAGQELESTLAQSKVSAVVSRGVNQNWVVGEVQTE